MRKWHRWIMTSFAVLIVYWVISGLVMAGYDALDATQVWRIEGGGPGARLDDSALTARPIPAPEAIGEGITRSLAATSIPVASVDLRMVNAGARLQLAETSGTRATMRRFFAATGQPMSDRMADGNPDARPQPNVTRRNFLKSMHRGDVAGLTGQVLGLATGLAVIAMTVTGIVLYVQMWKARCRMGKCAFFWNARDTLWRRTHRWISIVAAAFILNLAISGCVLALGELQLHLFLDHHIGRAPYPRPSPLPQVSEAPLTGSIPAMLSTTYRAAIAMAGQSPVTSIELIRRDGEDKGLATFGGSSPRTVAFDAITGLPVTDWRTGGVQRGNGYFADWHQVVKRIHRGDIVGVYAARYMNLLTGLALLYLTISGLVLYITLLRRRRSLDKPSLFWR